MGQHADDILNRALQQIRNACTDQGILAGIIDADNYRRIWARDGIVGGLAGILSDDRTIIDGLGNTLSTLWNARDQKLGTIPSNVDPNNDQASFGSLVGRVDATTWFLVGAAQYIMQSKDFSGLEFLQKDIKKEFKLLSAWEFNGKHLIYTPMSGNWADEYPYHGYLLYDNLLYFWAASLWGDLLNNHELKLKAHNIKTAITINFWMTPDLLPKAYHKGLYERNLEDQPPYFICGFHPGGIFKRFDAAGNALALILGFYSKEQLAALQDYLASLWSQESLAGFIPAFWPTIDEHDEDWTAIATNYNYQFKNQPHHFHNGGIWPVWMGLTALGLRMNGLISEADKIQDRYKAFLVSEDFAFSEYIESQFFIGKGQKPLTYSASGYVFCSCKHFSNLVTKK